MMFQFTHPVRGATRRAAPRERRARVSIHAPREGCDKLGIQPLLLSSRFQFTHPVRGATSRAVSEPREI